MDQSELNQLSLGLHIHSQVQDNVSEPTRICVANLEVPDPACANLVYLARCWGIGIYHSTFTLCIFLVLDQYCSWLFCLWYAWFFPMPATDLSVNLHLSLLTHLHHMSMNLSIFRVLIHFTGYDSVHSASHYPVKMGPTGIAWGLMHIPVMMHYPMMDGISKRVQRHFGNERKERHCGRLAWRIVIREPSLILPMVVGIGAIKYMSPPRINVNLYTNNKRIQ